MSYCRDDNVPLAFESIGWVDVFRDTLKKRIMVRAGREHCPEIFFDKDRVEGNDRLTDALSKHLREAVLIVPVISPCYVTSNWCKWELRGFCELRGPHAGLEDAAKSRVFLVYKNHDDDVKVRLHAIPGVRDAPGYEFHQDGLEMDPLTSKEHAFEYKSRVDTLARTLLKTLGLLLPRETSGVTIFLGDGSRDINSEVEELRKELGTFGHEVVRLPADRFHDPETYRVALRGLLATCRLAIHPVGSSYGSVPDMYDVSPAVMQYEEAAAELERRPGEFEQLAWILPGVSSMQERQQQFIGRLEARGPELLHELSLEHFKTRVHEVLAPVPTLMTRPASAPTPPAAAAEMTRKPLVYVVCDQRDDVGRVTALVKLLTPHFNVVRSLLAGEIAELAKVNDLGLEADLRRDHESHLASCDGLMIFYGEAQQLWLRAKLLEMHNAPGYGRRRPFAASAILLSDPRRDKESDDDGEVLLLKGFGELSAAMVEPFVAAMNRAFEKAG